ncbi:hypothetical protein [Nocardia sp. NPDC051750]|uniref:hypothetical protein n=1 Tax=Nocardia sp. NPDC051750 TaxID=3364325 RepID=UPI0037BD9A97
MIPAIGPIIVFAVLNGSYAAEFPPAIAAMLNGQVLYTDTGITVGFLIAAAVAFLGVLAVLFLPCTGEQIEIDAILADGRQPAELT